MSHDSPTPALPQAIVRRVAPWHIRLLQSPLAWLGLPLLALAAVVWQVKVHDMVFPKPTLVVHFQEGYGIKPGDFVKYRGIVVGDIVAVTLEHTSIGDSIRLDIALQASANHLCRQGSQFWIVRPVLGIGQINGMETFANGVYVAVEPGTSAGQHHVVEFVGRESPPAQEIRSPAGLQVIVESPERNGLEPGSPVRFRGFTVGHVMEVALAGDSGTVDARVYIQPDYKKLIRVNTQFWSNSGLSGSAKLFDFSTWGPKVNMNMDTLTTVMSGGLAFSTPPQPGAEVPAGQRFKLASAQDVEKKKEEWLGWKPNIEIGAKVPAKSGSAAGSVQTPVPMTVTWETSGIFYNPQHKTDWLVLQPEPGVLVGAAEAFRSPGSGAKSVLMHINGKEYPQKNWKVKESGGVARCGLGGEAPDRWGALEKARDPEDCRIVTEGKGGAEAVLLADRLKTVENAWEIDVSAPIPAGSNGAPVVTKQGGRHIGFLVANGSKARIVLWDGK